MNKTIGPLVKVKRTSTGLGLVATTIILKGTAIIQYVGPILPNAEAYKIAGMYLFRLSRRRCIDGSSRRNIARYINHSCTPNAEALACRYEMWIYATKTIQPGEEVTIDYGEEYFNEFIKPKGCKCVSCRQS